MTTSAPLVVIAGQVGQLPSGSKLGPVTGGTATGEVMTQDQFGANSTQMTPSGSPTHAALTLTSPLTPGNGGTGQSSFTNGQILIGNTTGNTLTKAAITQASANQVIVTNGAGSITLSLPQSIDTAATPQFGKLGLGGAAGTSLLTFPSSTSATGGITFGDTSLYRDSTNSILCTGRITSASYKTDGNMTIGASLVYTSNTTAYDTANVAPVTYSTNGSGSYPFAEAGNLIVQSRPSGAARDVLLVCTVGGTVQPVLIAQRAGNVLIGTTTVPSGATWNHVLGGGATSSVRGAATADMVSQAAVDNGAGNREWQTQPETGGYVAYGSDNLRRVPSSTQDCQQAIKTINTTDATQTTLHTIPITSGRTYFIESAIIARRTGGASGTADDGASYVRRATYTTKSGTVTLMGSVQTIGTDAEDQAGWDVTFAVSGANVLIRVTGASANNVTWTSDTAIKSVAS
jgi:hypothetical protein